jgi:hypothetical protein
MSEYVEARYARLMLRDLHTAKQDEATKQLSDLLRDLGSPRRLSSAGAEALTSIRLLAQSLDRPRSLDVQALEAANQAAEAWCQSAFL